MKIYIAGKISGEPRIKMQMKFLDAAEILIDQGHEPFVPSILPEYDDVSHDDYLHICFAMIDVCDAVYMLSDWQQSKGARKELQYAADTRKEIVYQDASTKEKNFPIMHDPWAELEEQFI